MATNLEYECSGKKYNEGQFPKGMTKEEADSAYEAVSEFLNQFDSEIFMDLYGDHAEITIYRDGCAIVAEHTDHN